MTKKENIPSDSENQHKVDKPKLSDKALSGVAGSIVKTILPHTEADEAALLSQLLAGFGNVIGSSPHFLAEADRHGTNIFVVNVGESSKARKGSSWGRIEALLKIVAPEWHKNRIKSGLASGEGLINAVKDSNPEGPTETFESDKRLLCLETEFGSVLQVLIRDGNTLSSVLRNAWDSKNLATLAKNSPLIATEPHISLIGHITKFELLKLLRQNDIANGLGNRILFFYVSRSKTLPEGGHIDQQDEQLMIQELKESVAFAEKTGLVIRDIQAKELWSYVYPSLSEGRYGLVGSLSARGEAQVMRLALILALMDRSKVICINHLETALEIFSYCITSLNFIYGSQTGNNLADRIKDLLDESPKGRTRREIRDFTSRNQIKDSLEAALQLLKDMHLVHCLYDKPEGGRPAERWISIKYLKKDDQNDISHLWSFKSYNLRDGEQS